MLLGSLSIPGGLDGKESTCNAGDPGSIPGSGRSPGERNGLVAQKLKHFPGMRETLVLSLGREDPLEKEMATHSSILAWEVPRTEECGRLWSMGSQRVGYD